MRRVPFDDKTFRQSMGYVYPYQYLVNDLRQGKSVQGDYVAAAAWDTRRPESFDEPNEHGPDQTESGEPDFEKAQSMLESADGKHDFSFGSVESSQVTGDQEIRINGETLPEAHTDNDGNAGNGPLEMIMSPPSEAPVASKASARFVENLNELGIPAVKRPIESNTQTEVVWQQEAFDMWESGWIWMIPPDFSMDFWLRSDRADMDSSSNEVHLNPMGYSNADEEIEAIVNTYEEEAQIQAAKEALARVYEDKPILVTEYPDRINATNTEFTGWVKFPGGIAQNVYSYLNVRPA
jgi:peptide/nickel transport system substrate-binding protein